MASDRELHSWTATLRPFRYAAEFRVHLDIESPGYSMGIALVADRTVIHLERASCVIRGPWNVAVPPTRAKWNVHWGCQRDLRHQRSASEVSCSLQSKPLASVNVTIKFLSVDRDYSPDCGQHYWSNKCVGTQFRNLPVFF